MESCYDLAKLEMCLFTNGHGPTSPTWRFDGTANHSADNIITKKHKLSSHFIKSLNKEGAIYIYVHQGKSTCFRKKETVCKEDCDRILSNGLGCRVSDRHVNASYSFKFTQKLITKSTERTNILLKTSLSVTKW